MPRDLKPGGRAERLARLEWEVSELRHSITTLRWMVGATLLAVVLPMLFSIPPLSWVASAVRATLEVLLWTAALFGIGLGGAYLWRSLRRGRSAAHPSSSEST